MAVFSAFNAVSHAVGVHKSSVGVRNVYRCLIVPDISGEEI